MKILLLSAYDADSHQYWRKGLVNQFPQYQWTVLTLPGRYFSWRIRGNSLSWAFGEHAQTLSQSYDLIIATSMTDLSALRGFVPSLSNTPCIVYFHENQFAYPATSKAKTNVEPQILNLYTALSADKVVFNSQYNLNSFLWGATALLKKLPDQVPTNIVHRLTEKSQVLAVPLSDKPPSSVIGETLWTAFDHYSPKQKPLLIVWAARWEYDKGPDRLLAIVALLETRKVNFRLCIMGQKFRQVPEAFSVLADKYAHRIDQFGYAHNSLEYFSWLQQADIFLSTAIHEFQGLSLLEAIQAKCIPVLPDRLVYPELVEAQFLYASHPQITIEAENALEKIVEIGLALQQEKIEPAELSIDWLTLRAGYQQLIEETAAGI